MTAGPATLLVDERALIRMRRHARRAGGLEACGLLLARAGRADVAEGAVACPNLSPDAARAFRIDPGRWVRCERLARALGLVVVGVWHSHPRGGASPSAADLAGAPAGLWSVVLDASPGAEGTPAEVSVWRPGSRRLARGGGGSCAATGAATAPARGHGRRDRP